MEQNVTYLANARDAETGREVYAAVNEEFKRGPELNEELLMRILRDNKDTEYGQKYGFADITSVEEYQKKIWKKYLKDFIELIKLEQEEQEEQH